MEAHHVSDDVLARAASLRAEVAQHKAAIRRHRAGLWSAKAALKQLEAECRLRGIAVVAVEPPRRAVN